MSNITFLKAKVGDKIRLTGTDWNREDYGLQAGDIVTVTSLSPGGMPTFGEGGWYVYKDQYADFGGELVEEVREGGV